MSHHERTVPGPASGAAGPFAVECPACRAHIAVTIGLVGRAAGCPGCGAAFLVPAPPPEVRPSGPPQPVIAVAPVSDDGPVAWHDPPLPVTRQRREEPPVAPAPTVATAPPAGDATAAPAAVDTVPSGDVAAGGYAFQEPVKTIRSGDAEIELRRLTAEERRSRRARRNLLLLVVGAALLVALVAILVERVGH